MKYRELVRYHEDAHRFVMDVVCGHCGFGLRGSERFCPECGAKLDSLPYVVELSGDLQDAICAFLEGEVRRRTRGGEARNV